MATVSMIRGAQTNLPAPRRPRNKTQSKCTKTAARDHWTHHQVTVAKDTTRRRHEGWGEGHGPEKARRVQPRTPRTQPRLPEVTANRWEKTLPRMSKVVAKDTKQVATIAAKDTKQVAKRTGSAIKEALQGYPGTKNKKTATTRRRIRNPPTQRSSQDAVVFENAGEIVLKGAASARAGKL